jgi:putative intracellular protease/amidase
MARVLVPLPDHDFDTTEVSVPWRLLTDAGHDVVFATESGATPACDPLLLTGVIFGQLGADPEPIAFYEQLQRDSAFCAPLVWSALDPLEFDALLLPGGHAPAMRQFLGSAELQDLLVTFWRTQRPVAAICHGVLPLARAVDPDTGRSLLHGVRTTCLPAYMEWLAYSLTFWKLGRYYRTYPETVQAEVEAALAEPAHFDRGPITIGTRGTATDDGPAFVVRDGRYLSARWPGDAYAFARALIDLL